jgi:hypothetical protein
VNELLADVCRACIGNGMVAGLVLGLTVGAGFASSVAAVIYRRRKSCASSL